MCAFDSLFHDPDTGYVLRCKECDHLQLAFGNIVLTLQERDYPAFVSWLKEIEEEHAGDELCTLKNIVLPTPCEGMRMMFSLVELRKLNAMLDEADSELQSRRMLNLFR
ncbi:MAG: hypothetical protein QM664_03475 [Flavihumibacter sp.]